MIIGTNNFGVREKNGMIFFQDDFGSLKAVKKLNGKDVRDMKKALRSLEFYDLKNGIRRNKKKITNENTSKYMLERNFVSMFEPIEAYIEKGEKKEQEVLMAAYLAAFGQNSFDFAAYTHFKDMFKQLVDIYKDIIR